MMMSLSTNMPRRALPSAVQDSIRKMTWPLGIYQPLKLQSIEVLAAERSYFPVLGRTEDTLTVLQQGSNKPEANHWARIATALIYLGHGYTDEAHNLVGPLCFPEALPFYHGPSVVTSAPVLAAASYVHALVHRQEGPCISEYETTGFDNSDFWAGAALRCGGEESLPLRGISEAMRDLGRQTSQASTEWVERTLQIYTFEGLEWDPRPLTELCAQIGAAPLSHPLWEFCERAALLEIRVLLAHALGHLGYEADFLAQHPLHPPNEIVQALPRTIEEARQLTNHAIVVTTAQRPYTIMYVNQAWVDLCGFTADEAYRKTFDIIQGPESDTQLAGATVKRCLGTLRPQEIYLINYTKQKNRFINHLAIRPLMTSQGRVADWLVGILEEVPQIPFSAFRRPSNE